MPGTDRNTASFATGATTRRGFLRGGAGLLSGAALGLPALAQATAPSGQTAGPARGIVAFAQEPAGTVILSANENPLGPSAAALEAIAKYAPTGGRYDRFHSALAVRMITEEFGLKPDYCRLYPGSGGPLDLTLLSNVGPDKPLIYGNPTYEQGPLAAKARGAQAIGVPLNSKFAFDVKAMLAAHPNPGAYYVVNPNNPTGTITPREDIVWLIKNKPAGSLVIVDEAYHHFSDQESVLDMVAADHELIVTRTFSKIYGMAGLRAGFVFGRPDLLQRFDEVTTSHQEIGSISVVSAAAAHASLADKQLVPLRRKINRDNRESTLEFLEKHGYHYVPGSQANMFMVDVKRPGREVQQAMLQQKVAVGRVWPALPNHVRVTVGTREEMVAFQNAFVRVMNEPTSPVAAHLHSDFEIPSELRRA